MNLPKPYLAVPMPLIIAHSVYTIWLWWYMQANPLHIYLLQESKIPTGHQAKFMRPDMAVWLQWATAHEIWLHRKKWFALILYIAMWQ